MGQGGVPQLGQRGPNEAPFDPRLHWLARALRDALPVLQTRKLADAARVLLAEAKKSKPNRRTLYMAQDAAVTALAAMVAHCTSGALGLLLLEEFESHLQGVCRS